MVLGAASNAERDVHMATLLDQGFEELDVPVIRRGPVVASSRLPSLVAGAQAATLALPPSPRPILTLSGLPRPPARGGAPAPVRWGIQVGTFASERAARQAASVAARVAEAGEARVEQVSLRNRPAWRAQLVGLTATEAQSACGGRAKRRSACFVIRPDAGQVASR